MIIGIPKEIKNHEYRVGATPDMVRVLSTDHEVIIQDNAGAHLGFSNEMYRQAGARIVPSAKDVWEAEMIIKVKEPQESEFPLLKRGQILFCYLHLAPDPHQTKHLLEKGVVGIAYETVTDAQNRLPLLIPMSEIAGRIAVQAGATALQMANNGRGVLLGGVPGVAPGKVVVIGGGIVGTHSARMAIGLGADVTIFDNNLNRLRELESIFGQSLKTLFSAPSAIEKAVAEADLVIGSVLIPGKMAPKLVTENMVKKMQPGSVIVDVAIDQGGCVETSRPTTHSDPTYVMHNVVHYCVTNMPGACARTATQALTNATMPYALKIANVGYRQALRDDYGLLQGLNVCYGRVTNRYVAQDLGYAYLPAEQALSIEEEAEDKAMSFK